MTEKQKNTICNIELAILILQKMARREKACHDAVIENTSEKIYDLLDSAGMTSYKF